MIKYQGRQYKTPKDLFDDKNSNPDLTYKAFNKRITGKEMTSKNIKQALEAPIQKNRKLFYKGKIYETASELFKEHKINKSLTQNEFVNRIKKYSEYHLEQKHLLKMLTCGPNNLKLNTSNMKKLAPNNTFEVKLLELNKNVEELSSIRRENIDLKIERESNIEEINFLSSSLSDCQLLLLEAYERQAVDILINAYNKGKVKEEDEDETLKIISEHNRLDEIDDKIPYSGINTRKHKDIDLDIPVFVNKDPQEEKEEEYEWVEEDELEGKDEATVETKNVFKRLIGKLKW